jgi:hypothetical protein
MPKETTKETRKKEGWSWLFNSGRCHYFVCGRSLCGRVGILGYGDCDDQPPSGYSPCATCMKELKKRKQEGGE